eukprot:1565439-Rhodomonas_salina.2
MNAAACRGRECTWFSIDHRSTSASWLARSDRYAAARISNACFNAEYVVTSIPSSSHTRSCSCECRRFEVEWAGWEAPLLRATEPCGEGLADTAV